MSSHRLSPSHLQEAEKQNRGLQQELAALREELRTRGPGGEWPSTCLFWSSPPLLTRSYREGPPQPCRLWRQEFVPDCHPTTC